MQLLCSLANASVGCSVQQTKGLAVEGYMWCAETIGFWVVVVVLVKPLCLPIIIYLKTISYADIHKSFIKINCKNGSSYNTRRQMISMGWRFHGHNWSKHSLWNLHHFLIHYLPCISEDKNGWDCSVELESYLQNLYIIE